MQRTEDGEIIRGTIDDRRLVPGMHRARSGHIQMFGERIIRGPNQQECDFQIIPPNKSWYALEVDGVWMWVEGCDICNGQRKDYAYIRCEDHDCCITCGVKRAQASTSKGIDGHGWVWGMRGGWMCNGCYQEAEGREKIDAEARIAERDEEGETECSMANDPTCPWCGSTWEAEGEDYGACDEVHQCNSCKRSYSLTAVHMVYWSSERK
ncbi:hypothetical protein [Pantoea phage Nafs113]|nr:hypothetical protein [Pantoea phage Nafs113]